ncbi:hypothetical protein NFI96_000709, partial [Prochilodus magdalenae]
PVSKPIIRNQAGRRSVSHRESCSPLCSVENGKGVNLSWYGEKERISSITSTDSSERLYLPLNITHLSCSTYTCVAANPVSNQTAQLNITDICPNTGLLCVAGEEVIRLQELEGNTVTIHTGGTGVQSDAHILWSYISDNVDIKIVDSLVFKGETNTDYNRDRFRDRLQLDRTSGSLTIRNISREDSGVYKLHIITGTNLVWSFSVDVYAPASKPTIRNQAGRRSVSQRESCSPLCSVENGKDVNLSWYEGEERISSNTSTDSSERLYLPLNITHLSCSTYTCVAANPVSNQTTQLSISELCYNTAVGDAEVNYAEGKTKPQNSHKDDEVARDPRLLADPAENASAGYLLFRVEAVAGSSFLYATSSDTEIDPIVFTNLEEVVHRLSLLNSDQAKPGSCLSEQIRHRPAPRYLSSRSLSPERIAKLHSSARNQLLSFCT